MLLLSSAHALTLSYEEALRVANERNVGVLHAAADRGAAEGALLASRMIRRFGLPQTVRWGTLAAVISLALCAVSDNFFVLSFARLLAGVGAAGGFVGVAALAATIAQTRPERANFLLSLF